MPSLSSNTSWPAFYPVANSSLVWRTNGRVFVPAKPTLAGPPQRKCTIFVERTPPDRGCCCLRGGRRRHTPCCVCGCVAAATSRFPVFFCASVSVSVCVLVALVWWFCESEIRLCAPSDDLWLMETGRNRPESPGYNQNSQAGTHGIGKYRRKHGLFESERGWVCVVVMVRKVKVTTTRPPPCFSGGSDSNKGKSKKWRKILQFPHISQCIELINKIGKYFLW